MSRNITDLHPVLQNKIAELKTLCENNGLKIGISECLRSVEEQDNLYAKGRTIPGKKVTNARGSSYSSQHQWGIAVDFYRNDGTGTYNESGNFFQVVGQLAKSIGLAWGGDWTTPVDKPHLYLPDWGKTPSKLKSKYGTPAKFFVTWDKAVNSSQTDTSSITSKYNTHLHDLQSAINTDKIACLVVDGIWGTNSKNATKKCIVKNKSKGNVTAWVQCRVGTTADGIAGSKTVTAIKLYQSKKGLSTDGCAGYNTITSILRDYGVNC